MFGRKRQPKSLTRRTYHVSVFSGTKNIKGWTHYLDAGVLVIQDRQGRTIVAFASHAWHRMEYTNDLEQ